MAQSDKKILVIADSITVGELAETLNLPVTQLVGELFKNGNKATINQRIDFETAKNIVEELGLEAEKLFVLLIVYLGVACSLYQNAAVFIVQVLEGQSLAYPCALDANGDRRQIYCCAGYVEFLYPVFKS